MVLGHHIPAGTHIFFNMPGASLVHTPEREHEFRARDPLRSESSRKNGLGGRGYFKDTNLFQPERWLDKDGHFNAKAGWTAPFGLGIRACAGKALAVRGTHFDT